MRPVEFGFGGGDLCRGGLPGYFRLVSPSTMSYKSVKNGLTGANAVLVLANRSRHHTGECGCDSPLNEFGVHAPAHVQPSSCDIESPTPVTIIVLAHNTPELLQQCLQSFYEEARTYRWQILAVDNGSDYEVSRAIDGKFRNVEVIRSERNLGFAAGNNLGLGHARGEFVILMNSDVLARAEILSALVEAIKKDWRVGAMSPGLLTVEGQSQPFAYGAEATPGYIIRRALRFVFGFGPLHDWATQDPLDVDWVSAACICVRRELIGQIGELGERFPLYFEDVDWCLRMRAGGWRVVYNPNLRVIHLGGASQLSGNVKRKDLYYRSLLLFCDKHYGRNWKLLIQILLIPYRLYATARLWIQNIFQKP